MIVVGAGLAGLLAGSMLRDDVSSIIEKQSALPNNHKALLRFRSSVVGDITGIPFKKVRVMKAIQPWKNPVADALAYSFKCTGTHTLRSSVSAAGEIETRYIAPDDFIKRLGAQSEGKIALGVSLDELMRKFAVHPSEEPIISTIPMPLLMKILDYGFDPEFNSSAGGVISFDLPDTNVYATVYFPDPRLRFYRASITGSRVILETADAGFVRAFKKGKISHTSVVAVWEAVNKAIDALGIGQSNISIDMLLGTEPWEGLHIGFSAYAKILPINEAIRKRFIIWASEKHNIYSLGRFATWRPALLLDDIVEDVRIIQSLISGNPDSIYLARMEAADG